MNIKMLKGYLFAITSVVTGILVFQESVSVGTVLGTFVVIAASVLIAVADMKKEKQDSAT